MGKKNNRKYAKESSAVEDRELDEQGVTAQVWNALKKDDPDLLRAILMEESAGVKNCSEVLWMPRPHAKEAVTQLHAKKILPLEFAVSEGLQPECVQILLQCGAPINKHNETKTRSTALHSACWNDDAVMIQLLLRGGADLREADADGRTPLHVLASSTAAPLMEHILEFVASPPPRREDELYVLGKVPLRLDPLDLLCKQDKQGSTALHLALSEAPFGKSIMASTLLQYLEEKIKTTDAEGGKDTASQKVSELLHSCTRAKSTPLHVLFESSGGDVRTVLKVMEQLLRLGADVRAKNEARETVLHLALSSVKESATNTETQEKIFTTLFTAAAASESGQSTAQLRDVLSGLNTFGDAWIHTLIAERCSVALTALEAFLVKRDDAAALKECLTRVSTAQGEQTAEILAAEIVAEPHSQCLSSIASTLQRMGSLHKETFGALVEEMKDVAAELKDMEEVHSNTAGDYTGYGSGGAAAGSSRTSTKQHGSGAGVGISRVQRARKSRALRYMKEKEEREKREGDLEDSAEPAEELNSSKKSKKELQHPSPSSLHRMSRAEDKQVTDQQKEPENIGGLNASLIIVGVLILAAVMAMFLFPKGN